MSTQADFRDLCKQTIAKKPASWPRIVYLGPRSRSVHRIATMTKVNDSRQKLFNFSGAMTSMDDPSDAAKELTQATLNKIQIDHDVEIGLRGLQKELHEQRLKNLRELIKVINQDDWMYPSADKLIGLE